MKYRIEKAVAQNKNIFITSPAVQKIKARKHIYDLFKVVTNNVPGHLKTVARFHDLGKYVARQKSKLSNYDTFINHENVSAMYALVNRCSPRDVRIIQFHMMAHNLTPALVRRYHLEDIEEDLRIFAKADTEGKILPENKWSAKPKVIQKDEPQEYRLSELLKHGF